MTLLTHIGEITVDDLGTGVSLTGYSEADEYLEHLELSTDETERLVEALIPWLEGRGVRRFKIV